MAASGMGLSGLIGFLALLAGTLAGIPPGERDANLVRCAPKEALVYFEWSARGAGKPGAAGIDGLAADPEVRQFLADVEKVLIAAGSRSPSRQVAALVTTVPTLTRTILARPGCLWFSFDEQAANAAADKSGSPSPETIVAGLRGALVINGGDQADAIGHDLAALLALLPNASQPVEFKGKPYRVPGPAFPLLLQRHNQYFLAATSEASLRGAIAGLAGQSKGLLDNERFLDAQKQVQGERTAAITWIDVKTAVANLSSGLGALGQFVDLATRASGLNAIDTVAYHTGVENGRVHTVCLISTNGSLDGLLTLAAGRKIVSADLSHVPADSDLVIALSINLKRIYDEIEKVVDGILGAGAQFDETVKRFEDSVGFSLKKDFFPAFGDVWTVYDSPSEGGVLVTSLVASLEVRDAAKANAIFERLLKLLKQRLSQEGSADRFRLEERPFLGNTIYFVNTLDIYGGPQPPPFAPAFCLTKKHLVAALHPQALKAQLRFMHEKGPSLATFSGVKALEGEGAPIAYAMLDSKRLLGILYAAAPYVGQQVARHLQGEGVPLDVFSLPSARGILPYFGNSTFQARRLEKGIRIETRSTLPYPSAPILLLGAGAATGVRHISR